MIDFKSSLFFLLFISVNGYGTAAGTTLDINADAGTYHAETTESIEACAALCDADTENICRGYVFSQPDTRYSSGECILNNGLGAIEPFTVPRPANIDIEQVLSDINDYRSRFDLGPLKWSEPLMAASNVHAQDLAVHGILQHEGTDGSNHGDRAKQAGYNFRLALENVAAGQKSWEDALQGWKDSPGHNENLLNKDVTEIGVALDFNPETRFATYWTMLLAKPLRLAK